MYRDSIYQKILQEGSTFKAFGYDYRKGGLTNRFFSKRMFMNPVMNDFIKFIELYFSEILDSVKKLQFYQNFTIDKNDRSINV